MMNGLVAFGLGYGTLLFPVLIFLLAIFLAKRNIFFTFVKEGRYKNVEKSGQFHHAIMAIQGHYFTDNWTIKKRPSNKSLKDGEVLPDEKTIPKIDRILNLLFGGVRWVGIWPIYKVSEFNFGWMSFEQREKNGKVEREIKSHYNPNQDYGLGIDDVYFADVTGTGAETLDMIPVKIGAFLTGRVVNPFKAHYRVQNWLEMTINRVGPVLRSFIANNSYQGAIRRVEEASSTQDILLTGTELNENLEADYGFCLYKVGFAYVDPAGTDADEIQRAGTKKWLAAQEVERIDAEYGKVKAMGDRGLYIRTLETFEKMSRGQGTFIPFPIGGVQQIGKMLMGKFSPESNENLGLSTTETEEAKGGDK